MFYIRLLLLLQYDEVKEKKLEHDRKKAQLTALEENWMVFKVLHLNFWEWSGKGHVPA